MCKEFYVDDVFFSCPSVFQNSFLFCCLREIDGIISFTAESRSQSKKGKEEVKNANSRPIRDKDGRKCRVTFATTPAAVFSLSVWFRPVVSIPFVEFGAVFTFARMVGHSWRLTYFFPYCAAGSFHFPAVPVCLFLSWRLNILRITQSGPRLEFSTEIYLFPCLAALSRFISLGSPPFFFSSRLPAAGIFPLFFTCQRHETKMSTDIPRKKRHRKRTGWRIHIRPFSSFLHIYIYTAVCSLRQFSSVWGASRKGMKSHRSDKDFFPLYFFLFGLTCPAVARHSKEKKINKRNILDGKEFSSAFGRTSPVTFIGSFSLFSVCSSGLCAV